MCILNQGTMLCQIRSAKQCLCRLPQQNNFQKQQITVNSGFNSELGCPFNPQQVVSEIVLPTREYNYMAFVIPFMSNSHMPITFLPV